MKDDGFAARSGERIGRFPSVRILVVGDLMLDEYVWGTVRRISPEAPVPVVAVTRETKSPGGAANVALNIAGLGARAEVAGLVGEDAPGREVARLLRRHRVGTAAVIRDRRRPTTVKTRVIAHSQQVVRVDREERESPGDGARAALQAAVLRRMEACDGVVLSDYRKGTLSRELVEAVVRSAKERGIFVAVDPKQIDFAFYRGCTLITPNRSEAEAALGGRELRGDLEIGEGGKALLRRCGAKAVLVTRGEEGMTLVERGRKAVFHIPAVARQVYDVTGAGDTVIGALAVALAAGASVREAALLANLSAGVVVGEVGTARITAEKLRRAIAAWERERSAP
ncbi:MAG: hypothetical protein Kow00128_12400 [Deltaproteobacteria bacterium]